MNGQEMLCVRPILHHREQYDTSTFAADFRNFISDFNAKVNINNTKDIMEEFSLNGIDKEANDEVETEKNRYNTDDADVTFGASNAARVPRQPAATRRFHGEDILCPFCRNNGETQKVYRSHAIRDRNGKVTCPVLRRYTCPICNASGDNAHTISYCPKQNQPATPPSICDTQVQKTLPVPACNVQQRQQMSLLYNDAILNRTACELVQKNREEYEKKNVQQQPSQLNNVAQFLQQYPMFQWSTYPEWSLKACKNNGLPTAVPEYICARDY